MGAKLGLSFWGRYIDWVFENRVLKKIFGPKREEDGSWRNCIMMNFITCILHLNFLGWLGQGGWGGRDMWHAWGRGEVFTGFWSRGPKGRAHWEDLSIGGWLTLRWTLGRWGSMGRTGFGWLRIGSVGELLWAWLWTFRFHKERILFDKLNNYKLFKEYPTPWSEWVSEWVSK
jgi:hypothetical protein